MQDVCPAPEGGREPEGVWIAFSLDIEVLIPPGCNVAPGIDAFREWLRSLDQEAVCEVVAVESGPI